MEDLLRDYGDSDTAPGSGFGPKQDTRQSLTQRTARLSRVIKACL